VPNNEIKYMQAGGKRRGYICLECFDKYVRGGCKGSIMEFFVDEWSTYETKSNQWSSGNGGGPVVHIYPCRPDTNTVD